MRTSALVVLALVLALTAAGCRRGNGEPPAEPKTEAASELPARVQLAVTITRAVEADPDQAEAILRQHGMTEEAFEELLYEIAENPELSRAYNAAIE